MKNNWPESYAEYEFNVIRRLRAAINAVEDLSKYDYIADRKLVADALALLNEVEATKRRFERATPGMLATRYDAASKHITALDAAVSELTTLLEGRIRFARPGEGEEETDR